MKKDLLRKQHDMTDCGAACLSSIASFYGYHLPLSKVRQMACTDKKGTNVLGLVKAAEKLGFSAKGVKGFDSEGNKDPGCLAKIPTPYIAHKLLENNLLHYVVVYSVSKNNIEIMDPEDGKLHMQKKEEFIKEWTGYLVILYPNEDFEKKNEKVPIISRFFYLLKPHKKVLIQALLGSIAYTLMGLASAIFMQKLIDFVIPNGNRNLLNMMSIIMVAILLLSLLIGYIRSIFMMRTGFQINTRLMLGYYKHLLRLPQSFFDTMRSGEVLSRMGDAAKIQGFITETLIGLAINIFTVIFAFALMFTYYWKLAIILLLIIPFNALIFYFYNRVNKKVQRRMMEEGAELQAQLVESVNSAGTIKRFGIEDFTDNKTENKFTKLVKTGYRSGINSLVAGTSGGAVSGAFNIVLLWVGAYFVLDNYITPGELLSFYALTGYFVGPVNSLIGINRVYQDAKIAADRLFEIMDLDKDTKDSTVEISPDQYGDIKFSNVSFRYGSRKEIFNDLSLTIEKGKINSFVGETGSGKTTLVSLLQNLYPLTSGSISIGDVDIKHVDNKCLRSLIGVVPQRIDLFEGSVKENIILDDYEPDWNKVVKISKEVGMLEFIESLPAGFETNIGENGVQLSGGQRQRLAIARALYRDPEILILDEATSSLDSDSELHIKRIVNDLKSQGKTIILIAHRLGTVMNSDKIFVLRDGKLVESGRHRDLIAKKGHYENFWKSQTNFEL